MQVQNLESPKQIQYASIKTKRNRSDVTSSTPKRTVAPGVPSARAAARAPTLRLLPLLRYALVWIEQSQTLMFRYRNTWFQSLGLLSYRFT
jgi:hypothetical protein